MLSKLKKQAKKILVQHPNAARAFEMARQSAPSPETTPWLYAKPLAGYEHIQTSHGPVRYVPPRSTIPNTTDYPAAPPGPHVQGGKRELDRQSLAYYPRHFVADHPRKWDFPAYLDNPSCRWLQTLKGLYASPFSFPASLSPEAGLLVHSLIRNIRPRVIIETGTFIGMSTLWMAAALQENRDGGVVHTFDYFGPISAGPWREVEMREDRIGFVASNLAQAGLADQVVLHGGNTSFEIRAAHQELKVASASGGGGGVQFAFIDADHGIMGTNQDFWAVEPLLDTGGYILLHDTFPDLCGGYEGGRNLLDHANSIGVGTYEKVDLYLSPMNYGLGLLRRIG
ncbi:MAG: class I SAM-dependent methyltransferase [Phycisphaerales bacterium]|nr:class I SAM-dependent methyltransferase [Phycisphaerales bacterium]